MTFQVRTNANTNSRLFEDTLENARTACRALAAYFAYVNRVANVDVYDGSRVLFTLSSDEVEPMPQGPVKIGTRKIDL